MGGGELLNLSIKYGEKTYKNSREELHTVYKGRRGLRGKRCHGNIPRCMAVGGLGMVSGWLEV